ncbi:MAG: PhoH family protein [Candidatus Peribacteria bacterium]|jgi:PhoH-like ATPase|nr:PhoH family protein [Candidatus Peribacteria bacterium]
MSKVGKEGLDPLPVVKEEAKVNKKRSPRTKIKKTFVLDTNVLLHDASCLTSFKEHNVVIPMAVLEELDTFKKGTDQKNVNARECARILDRHSRGKIFNGGVSLGKGMGKLRISLGVEYPEIFKKSFSDLNKADHLILATAYNLQAEGENVVLVSKDLNLCIKARSLRVLAEDYLTDTVKNLEILDKPIRNVEKEGEIELLKDLRQNDFFRLKNDKLVYWRDGLHPVIKRSCSGIFPKNDEQAFAIEMLLDPDIQLVAITGGAGTGKSLIALAAAIEQQKSSKVVESEYTSSKKKKTARKKSDVAQTYEEIFVTRPIVTLSNKDLGALPGDLEEKMSPYLGPIYKTLDFIRRANCAGLDSRDVGRTTWMNDRRIRVETSLFIRGDSIPNTFMIIDEAQNITPHEVKTIATRAEEGTKIVFLGDPSQIDTPYLDEASCGINYLVDRARGKKYFAHINLVKSERSYLAGELAKIL